MDFDVRFPVAGIKITCAIKEVQNLFIIQLMKRQIFDIRLLVSKGFHKYKTNRASNPLGIEDRLKIILEIIVAELGLQDSYFEAPRKSKNWFLIC